MIADPPEASMVDVADGVLDGLSRPIYFACGHDAARRQFLEMHGLEPHEVLRVRHAYQIPSQCREDKVLILAPRWGRHPDRLVPLLRAQREVSGPSPTARAEQREERFRHALREVRSSLARGPRRATVELLVRTARRYLLLRENQRFWLDALLASLQDQLTWLGRWAAEGGHLDAADDVAFLTWPELQALVAGTSIEPLRERVAAACRCASPSWRLSSM
jgi:hypothetical protein